MLTKAELRDLLRKRLEETMTELNHALQGLNLERLEPVLLHVGRDQALPHWYQQLYDEQTLPNLDGKTVGSIIEMLFVAVLETVTFRDVEIPQLRLNPARGVDLPDLDLGIKAPSQNYATSEPFFSAYERLLGSEYEVAQSSSEGDILASSLWHPIEINRWTRCIPCVRRQTLSETTSLNEIGQARVPAQIRLYAMALPLL